MTTISADADDERSCCCNKATGHCRVVEESDDLPELLHRFRQRIDVVRAVAEGASQRSPGPADLALTVVSEALAIGEAMSRLAPELPGGATESNRSSAVYADIDSRFVEHRTRSLRSALNGVDDYVWWGSLATATG